jgi:CDP-paratose 2-epimerase
VARFIEWFLEKPRSGEIYNFGGGRSDSCLILEIFTRVKNLTGKSMQWTYSTKNRGGDHLCYISNLTKIQSHYTGWDLTKSLDDIFSEVVDGWGRG